MIEVNVLNFMRIFFLNNISRTCIPFFVSYFEEIKVKNLLETEVTMESKGTEEKSKRRQKKKQRH